MQMIRVEEIPAIVAHAASKTMLQRLGNFQSDYALSNSREDIEKFVGDAVQEHAKFAILSHRWGASEITLQDYRELWNMAHNRNKQSARKDSSRLEGKMATFLKAGLTATANSNIGQPLIYALNNSLLSFPDFEGVYGTRADDKFRSFRKLVKFCYLAHQEYSCDFAWVDTCCIDKASSAELEEAITSMFKWYRNSSICITHLASTNRENSISLGHDPWFQRGWTLQELLAPRFIKFYDKKWNPLSSEPNDKDEPKYLGEIPGIPLMETVSQITSIPISDLLNFQPGLDNIRERLRWASKRRTTRIEDESYCLLGIFDLNMPIAYGEGGAAFHRLQAAIMEESNDRSLFLWDGKPSKKSSMLARSPACFSDFTYFEIVEDIRAQGQPISEKRPIAPPSLDPTYSLTNHGLRIAVSLYSEKETVAWMRGAGLSTRDNFGQTFRLAVLAYSAYGVRSEIHHKLVLPDHDDNIQLDPIYILLVEKHFLKHVYYVRQGSYRSKFGYMGDMPAPSEPQIIYIR